MLQPAYRMRLPHSVRTLIAPPDVADNGDQRGRHMGGVDDGWDTDPLTLLSLHLEAKDEINVPLTLSVFRDKAPEREKQKSLSSHINVLTFKVTVKVMGKKI